MDTGILSGLTDEQVLNVRSLAIIGSALEKPDLIELLLQERKQKILLESYLEILVGDYEPSSDEMDERDFIFEKYPR